MMMMMMMNGVWAIKHVHSLHRGVYFYDVIETKDCVVRTVVCSRHQLLACYQYSFSRQGDTDSLNAVTSASIYVTMFM